MIKVWNSNILSNLELERIDRKHDNGIKIFRKCFSSYTTTSARIITSILPVLIFVVFLILKYFLENLSTIKKNSSKKLRFCWQFYRLLFINLQRFSPFIYITIHNCRLYSFENVEIFYYTLGFLKVFFLIHITILDCCWPRP